MGKTYVSRNLVNSGDFRVLADLGCLGEVGRKINYSCHNVSENPFSSSNISSITSRIESADICYLDLESGATDAWFGLGYALALGKPFVAAIEEDELPRLLSIQERRRMAFPAPGVPSTPLQEDRACLAAGNEPDFELKAGILACLASQDRYQEYGSLKCQIRRKFMPTLSAGTRDLAQALDSLLEEGLVREQYDVLGSEEVTETFTITNEGLTWLKRLEEARDPALTDNPEVGRSNLLFFAD